MTDDERRAALEAAYRTPLEDAVEHWRRKADEREAARQAAHAERKAAEAAHLVRLQKQAGQAFDERITTALAEHDRAWTDALGEVFAHERKLMRREVAEQVAQLRAEVTGENAKVIDLTALPRGNQIRRAGDAKASRIARRRHPCLPDGRASPSLVPRSRRDRRAFLP